MNQPAKKIILIFLLILLINSLNCYGQNDYFHQFHKNKFLNYENGLIYKSFNHLQDSITRFNDNLFPSLIDISSHSPFSVNLRKALRNSKFVLHERLEKFKKPNARLRFQQLNKDKSENQIIKYGQFFEKIKRYGTDSMENRQAMNLIKTLFRFPVLLLFSNIFQLPLLPTLILASPFLNNPEPNIAINSLSNSILKTPLSTTGVPSTGQPFSVASSHQTASNLPFSLNPLVPINQLLNNFISEVISELQNSPIFINLMQSLNQVFIKPNRINPQTHLQNLSSQNQPLNSLQLNQTSNLPKLVNQNGPNTSNSDLVNLISSNVSTTDSIYEESPNSNQSLPNIPLIVPTYNKNSIVTPNGGSILNTLANSLVESNKNYHLTETLGLNDANSLQDLAINSVNALATMLKIKKQKRNLNSNEDKLLDLLTNKNYFEQMTSISNLLKFILKQKMDKELNICLIKTICESNQKQFSFAFKQFFSLAMLMSGMETRIENSPWHSYYEIGRNIINEKNICKLIPKCRHIDEEKSFDEKKLDFLNKFSEIKKIGRSFSKRKESILPNYQKLFNIRRKARKIHFAKRLLKRSFRKANKLTKKMTKLFY